jgi:hypothetical protein
MACVDLA